MSSDDWPERDVCSDESTVGEQGGINAITAAKWSPKSVCRSRQHRLECQMTPDGAAAGSGIAKESVASLPEGWSAWYRASGGVLQSAAVVDARHQVLVCFVDHRRWTFGAGVPGQLTKFTDNEDHAPYRAKWLKLATFRHYREQHQELEGTWDPMEGRSRIASNLEEMCRRHGVGSVPHGARHVATEVTYQTEGGSFIYSTSRSTDSVSRYAQWSVASRIRNVPNFALLLGAEFARQRDDGWYAPVTPSTSLR